ncbi:MAG: DUF2214 family protein [Burkholderiaceae bacterium]|jgi:putative membrane protein|nr:DUF2214 family protein [Burkholderiaceae bacterium]
MTLEAVLAYLHILAILTLVVFISSETALCRVQWMSAAVIERLVRIDTIYAIALALVFASGFARSWWGMKGAAWYWSHSLLHLKLTMFIIVVLMSIVPARRYRRWRRALHVSGALPAAQEVRNTYKWLMAQAHLIGLIPLAAVFLARGFG